MAFRFLRNRLFLTGFRIGLSWWLVERSFSDQKNKLFLGLIRFKGLCLYFCVRDGCLRGFCDFQFYCGILLLALMMTWTLVIMSIVPLQLLHLLLSLHDEGAFCLSPEGISSLLHSIFPLQSPL